ncbi:hypothetical protein LguiA_031658 [Lonicera macranthoides]
MNNAAAISVSFFQTYNLESLKNSFYMSYLVYQLPPQIVQFGTQHITRYRTCSDLLESLALQQLPKLQSQIPSRVTTRNPDFDDMYLDTYRQTPQSTIQPLQYSNPVPPTPSFNKPVQTYSQKTSSSSNASAYKPQYDPTTGASSHQMDMLFVHNDENMPKNQIASFLKTLAMNDREPVKATDSDLFANFEEVFMAEQVPRQQQQPQPPQPPDPKVDPIIEDPSSSDSSDPKYPTSLSQNEFQKPSQLLQTQIQLPSFQSAPQLSAKPSLRPIPEEGEQSSDTIAFVGLSSDSDEKREPYPEEVQEAADWVAAEREIEGWEDNFIPERSSPNPDDFLEYDADTDEDYQNSPWQNPDDNHWNLSPGAPDTPIYGSGNETD